jgi:hypothetical protein
VCSNKSGNILIALQFWRDRSVSAPDDFTCKFLKNSDKISVICYDCSNYIEFRNIFSSINIGES